MTSYTNFPNYSTKIFEELCKSEFVQQTKGQIISEGNYGVLNFPKNQQIILRNSAQAGQIKQAWNQKSKDTLLSDI